MYTIVKIVLKMLILLERIVISDSSKYLQQRLQSFSHGTNDAQNQWVSLH